MTRHRKRFPIIINGLGLLVVATPFFSVAAQTPNEIKPTSSIAPGIAGVVAQGTPVELLATDLGGSEGPVAAPDGSLLFTAGPSILKVNEDGKIVPYLADANGITGLGFDSQGRLIAARTEPAQLLVLKPERKILLDTFDSKPLLRPNDLTIDKNGGIYFSDQPRRPTQRQVPGRQKGLLYLTPNGSVIQVDDQIEAPNGVVLSPDEKVLYAADSWGDTLLAFDVAKGGTLTNRRPFGHLEAAATRTPTGILRSADGLAVDAAGRLYAATRIGVEVFTPSGQYLGTIPITGGIGPQNVAFAGPSKQTLYVVGGRAIWRIRMLAQGYRGRAK